MPDKPRLHLVVEPTAEGFFGYVFDLREPPTLVAATEAPINWAGVWDWWREVKHGLGDNVEREEDRCHSATHPPFRPGAPGSSGLPLRLSASPP